MRRNYITKIPMMSAVIAICSLIAIPSPAGVPFTLQTFGVMLSGLILGCKGGGCSVLVYLAIGAAGLPVFSGFTGGAGQLLGVTGGYLWGFVPMAMLSGLGRGRAEWQQYILAVSGLAVCHAMGAGWLGFVMEMSFGKALLIGSVPYIIKDILSAAGAFAVYGMLKKHIAA